jgi:hypothetical protein
MRRLLKTTLKRRLKPINEELPPEPYRMYGPALVQTQSILFSVLSEDVRLLIYEAALSDPAQLLHIVSYRGKEKRRTMGHWHCVDAQSPFPTWQHSCHGIYEVEGGIRHRSEPRSNSNLLPLLLTCRIMQVFRMSSFHPRNLT